MSGSVTHTAFQPNAFQPNAFQILGGQLGGYGTGNVGANLTGGNFSRGRWHDLKEDERKRLEAVRRKREREEARRIAAEQKELADAKAERALERLRQDVDWALNARAQHQANATAAMQGIHGIAQHMQSAGLQDAAARQAQIQRLADEQDEQDIERLLLGA